MPRPTMHPLDDHSPLYVDVYIALRVLGMRYPEYIAQTTREERALYGLLMSLENLKESHAIERSKQDADMRDQAYGAIEMPYRS